MRVRRALVPIAVTTVAVAVAIIAAACSEPRTRARDAGAAAAAPATSAPEDGAAAAPEVATGTDDAGADAARDAGALAAVAPCPDDDTEAAAPPKDTLTLRPVDWDALPGWADDHHAEALPALAASCAKLDGRDPGDRMGVDGYSGKVRDWRRLCAAAAKVPPGDDAAARAMFERELRPYEARGEAGPEGKMTGYCVQPLRGSRTRHGAYQIPLYRRPADLVSIDLTSFIKDARGRRIWGRVQRNGAVVPYPTRAEIRRGALDGEHLELVWVDDAIDALFVQIEGSGKVTLDDGSILWLEFSGKNGRAYRGVGKVLRDLGELKKGQGTMPGIRAWFEAHPDRIDEILDKNTSMVFFAESSRPGAVGSQGVILTARRSLAVDRAFVAATTPIWVDTRAPHPGKSGEPPWRGLLIAQDTGGGILGPVRGDVYWGDDEDAADVAGRMGGPGRWWLLLPRALSPPTGPIPPGGH